MSNAVAKWVRLYFANADVYGKMENCDLHEVGLNEIKIVEFGNELTHIFFEIFIPLDENMF